MDALTNWLKEMLVGGIMGNLTGMCDSVNQQVADIATQVGQTPQGWNGSILRMTQKLSNSIMVPIAGVILAIVMTLEPVSYTHLDVYKRQVHRRPASLSIVKCSAPIIAEILCFHNIS